MLHLGTIEHGKNHYILLDYAEGGDLEQFLNGGIINGPAVPQYNHRSLFPSLHEEDLPIHLMKQCIGLAGALRWLHGNIELDDGKGKTSCVHMDLKPSNILIMLDPSSKVGKWKISDFGISVVKSEDSQSDGNVISVGDLSRIGEQSKANNTVNTRPRRHVGAYQAPEVKRSEPFIDVSRLTAGQKGVGRKSDVWSFGCILTEVLTFALGKTGRQAEHVKEFQVHRRGGRENDYFYEEAGHQRSNSTHLAARQPQKGFQVRQSVMEWLDDLNRRAVSPQRWIDCFVGTIKRILIVEKDNRPDAHALYNFINHVYVHTVRSKANASVSCPILSQPTAKPVDAEAEIGHHAYDVPNISGPKPSEAEIPLRLNLDIGFTSTSGSPKFEPTDRLYGQVDRLGGRSPDPVSGSGTARFTQGKSSGSRLEAGRSVPSPRATSNSGYRTSYIGSETIPEDFISPNSATSTRSSRAGLSKRPVDTGLSSPIYTTSTEGSKSGSSRPGSERSSQFVRKSSGFEKPSHLYGLLIEPEIPLAVQGKSNLQKLTSGSTAFSSKATALAVNPVKHIYDVAYLVLNHVHIFEADMAQTRCNARSEFSLEANLKWTNIALRGNYVAVWGGTHVSVIHKYHSNSNQIPSDSHL